jgi:hypothetical protein
MSELTPLREAVETLAARTLPPDFAELQRRAARRGRRRAALGVAGGAAAVIVAVGIAGAVLSGGDRSLPPAQQPSPSPTKSPTTSQEWTPERIRDEGSIVSDLGLEGDQALALSGLQAEVYCAGGLACNDFYYPDFEGRTVHWALNVVQGGESALFEVQGKPEAWYYDEDSILVHDGLDEALRFRLLQADGTTVELSMVDDPAPAVVGSDVVLVRELEVYRRGVFDPDRPNDHPYLVDESAGTVQPLGVPAMDWWGTNLEEFLWGGDGCRVMWQNPDGGFDHHDLDCGDGVVLEVWDYSVWSEPGRMAVVEVDAEQTALVVHASVDRGATWERIELNGGDVGEALGQLS